MVILAGFPVDSGLLPSEARTLNPRLVALSGPLTGHILPVGPEGLSLGRQSESSLQLRDPAVSRQHCVIEAAESGVLLRDLGSRHGTFVNGLPVRERRLEEGDLIAVGGSVFLFQVADGSGAPALGSELPGLEATAQLVPGEGLYARPDEALAALGADSGGRIARGLQALLEIGAALQSLGSTADLARELLGRVLAAIPGSRAALLLAEPESTEVTEVFAFARGTGPAEPFPVSRTVVRRVLSERISLLAADALAEESLAGAASVRAAHIRSLLAAPLIRPDRTLGLLYVDAAAQGVFDERDLALLAAVAGIAAAALATVQRIEQLEAENRRLNAGPGAGMVGESPRIREVYRILQRVAATDTTVLLRGESGTGKEVAARAVHAGSPRASRPFVAVNCATLSENLLESELFGHERGAFTGAVDRRIGKIEVADGGTLFLDEVGEIPVTLQAKLLRVLQERELERVGGTRPIRVDIRVIAATNRDLERALREGTFREDLFYRLNVVSVRLPALRERSEDIPLLASHFAAQTCLRLGRPPAGFTAAARTCLLRYDWPGNVRELANAVERAIVLGEGDLIRPEDLPETVLEASGGAGASAVGWYHDTLGETKRRLIRTAVADSGGSITEAANLLGLHPNYLHRLIRNLGLREGIG
jgi:Nif-specific regulatory protein